MKTLSIIILLFFSINAYKGSENRISFKTPIVLTDSIPPLNKGILTFVENNMGKKVDRGECWDLAAFALRSVDAKWDGKFQYGQQVYPDKEVIYAGDIIQFEKVVIEYREGNMRFQETMGPHTAIVYKVNDDQDYQIAHQNFGPWGRKVGVSNLKLANIKKGKIMIYRAVK